jgi:DNA excision repair protein ERCC-3
MCINNQSVKQWKEQFLTWTTLSEKSIKILSRDTKDSLPPLNEACVLITNYAMLTHGGKRSESAEIIINAIKKREWGLLILDEVHVAPAEQFQNVSKLFLLYFIMLLIN